MINLTGHKVAIEPLFDPDTTEGGIVIPDIAKERCDQGFIKYMSQAVHDEGELFIGDYVLFSGYSGTTIRLADEGTLIIMDADALVCKVLPSDTEIPGLYFKSRESGYFTATYEQAMHLVARAFENPQMRGRFGLKDRTSAREIRRFE